MIIIHHRHHRQRHHHHHHHHRRHIVNIIIHGNATAIKVIIITFISVPAISMSCFSHKSRMKLFITAIRHFNCQRQTIANVLIIVFAIVTLITKSYHLSSGIGL